MNINILKEHMQLMLDAGGNLKNDGLDEEAQEYFDAAEVMQYEIWRIERNQDRLNNLTVGANWIRALMDNGSPDYIEAASFKPGQGWSIQVDPHFFRAAFPGTGKNMSLPTFQSVEQNGVNVFCFSKVGVQTCQR
jgi:hypothetical protein